MGKPFRKSVLNMVLVDEVTVVTPLFVSLMEEVEEAVGFEAVSGFNKLSVNFRLNIEVESFSIIIFL